MPAAAATTGDAAPPVQPTRDPRPRRAITPACPPPTPCQPHPARPGNRRGHAAGRRARQPAAPRLADHRPGRRRQGHARLPLRRYLLAGRHPMRRATSWSCRPTTHVPPRCRRQPRRPAHRRAQGQRQTGRTRSQIAVTMSARSTASCTHPGRGGWRVAIVDGAEDLNQASANALLKILEEPPSRAILLLTCAAPGACRPPSAAAAAACACRRWPTRRWRNCSPPGCRTQRRRARRLVTLARARRVARCGWRRTRGSRSPAWWTRAGRAARPAAGARAGGGRCARPQRDRLLHFMELLRAGLAAAVRDTLRGHGDPDQQRLTGLRPLDAWGRCGTG